MFNIFISIPNNLDIVRTRNVLPHPVSPINITGIFALKRIIININFM